MSSMPGQRTSRLSSPKAARRPRDVPLPFADVPRHTPRHPILSWAGLFPPHAEPGLFHPVVLVHACMERRGGASEAMAEAWIGRAMRERMGVEAICDMIGKGKPLLAWPSERSLRRLHRLLCAEWRMLGDPASPT